MSLRLVTQQMTALHVGSSAKAKVLQSQNSSLCGQKLLLQPKQQQVAEIHCDTVCGKMKTRKAAAKRFSVTGTGKIRRRRPGKQHINEKMSRGKVRDLGKIALVATRDIPNVAPNLPYSGVRQSRN